MAYIYIIKWFKFRGQNITSRLTHHLIQRSTKHNVSIVEPLYIQACFLFSFPSAWQLANLSQEETGYPAYWANTRLIINSHDVRDWVLPNSRVNRIRPTDFSFRFIDLISTISKITKKINCLILWYHFCITLSIFLSTN